MPLQRHFLDFFNTTQPDRLTSSTTASSATTSAGVDVSEATTNSTILIDTDTPTAATTTSSTTPSQDAVDEQACQLLSFLLTLHFVGNTMTMRAHLQYIYMLVLLARASKDRSTAVSECGADCIVGGFGWKTIYLMVVSPTSLVLMLHQLARMVYPSVLDSPLLIFLHFPCIYLLMRWYSIHPPPLPYSLSISSKNMDELSTQSLDIINAHQRQMILVPKNVSNHFPTL
jgi:hypothetical protein